MPEVVTLSDLSDGEEIVDDNGEDNGGSGFGIFMTSRTRGHYLLDSQFGDSDGAKFSNWSNQIIARRKFSRYDNVRINRLRSRHPRYNLTLNIPEIWEHIMSYVSANNPRDAVKFCRAIETLGSWDDLEVKYITNFKERNFSSRIGVMAARKKIMSGSSHCMTCFKPMKSRNLVLHNTIDHDVPRCWRCMRQRFPMMQVNDARKKFLRMGMHMAKNFPASNKSTSEWTETDCACRWCSYHAVSPFHGLRTVKYRCSWYCLEADVKALVKEHKKFV